MSQTDPDFYVNKPLLRRAFDRAAASYDEAAVLQHEVAMRLTERLDYMKLSPQVILDAGSGTGFCTLALAQRYPEANIIALDLAEKMLQQARSKVTHSAQVKYLAGDVEQLALADQSVDLIVSNLTLQWCNDYQAAYQEFRRILRPGGCLLFTTFGTETLKELRHCWHQVDEVEHINSFIDMHHIGDTLLQAGFTDPVMDMEAITMTYSSVTKVMQDLKNIGAQNVLNGRRRTLTGKSRLAKVTELYEQFRADDVLPVSYEIIYGNAWVGEQPAGDTVVQVKFE